MVNHASGSSLDPQTIGPVFQVHPPLEDGRPLSCNTCDDNAASFEYDFYKEGVGLPSFNHHVKRIASWRQLSAHFRCAFPVAHELCAVNRVHDPTRVRNMLATIEASPAFVKPFLELFFFDTHHSSSSGCNSMHLSLRQYHQSRPSSSSEFQIISDSPQLGHSSMSNCWLRRHLT